MKKKMFSFVITVICLLGVYTLTGCSSGAGLEDVVKDGNKVTCAYEGVKREFIVCPPEETDDAPIILLLHGAGGSAEAFRQEIAFEKDANPLGYAVCYVTGSHNGKKGRNTCSWNYGRVPDDFDDVTFLKEVVRYLADEYSFDDDRVFCAGFSNGGFMNYKLAMEAQDMFTACVSVGGNMCKPLWTARAEKNDVGFMQITGERDESVPKNSDGTAKYALDPATEDIIEYLASSNGLTKQTETEIGKGSVLTKYGAEGDKDCVWNL
ncbi:MAG: prolyl oligopeptidase family serine peptidase, partial [Lachnospiraceae bacterium]|nr:prolyl oligopeptidase family serine peptidase [Lachnospiraceae bacterium]